MRELLFTRTIIFLKDDFKFLIKKKKRQRTRLWRRLSTNYKWNSYMNWSFTRMCQIFFFQHNSYFVKGNIKTLFGNIKIKFILLLLLFRLTHFTIYILFKIFILNFRKTHKHTYKWGESIILLESYNWFFFSEYEGEWEIMREKTTSSLK